jgi:hypothetical protein
MSDLLAISSLEQQGTIGHNQQFIYLPLASHKVEKVHSREYNGLEAHAHAMPHHRNRLLLLAGIFLQL